MEGFSFSTDVRVRFAETDAQGIAHHAAFLVWFEVARVAYLERHAGGYQSIRDRGVEALTTEVHVRYHRPRTSTSAHGVGALRRRARRAVPATSTGRAGRGARRGRLHEPRDGRPRDLPTRVPDWLAEACLGRVDWLADASGYGRARRRRLAGRRARSCPRRAAGLVPAGRSLRVADWGRRFFGGPSPSSRRGRRASRPCTTCSRSPRGAPTRPRRTPCASRTSGSVPSRTPRPPSSPSGASGP